MHVIMSVHVIQREAALMEGLKLRTNFLRQLATDFGQEKIAKPGPDQVRIQHAGGIDEIRNFARRQNRPAAHHGNMKANAEAFAPTGAGNRIFRSMATYHQAGSRQYPLFKSLFDCFVRGRRSTKIVSGDNQTFQAAFSRPQRKRKNSTPSRSCRFIRSQSLHIS